MFIVRIIDSIFFRLKKIKRILFNKYLEAKYGTNIKLINTNFGNNFSMDIKAENFKLEIGDSYFKNYGAINIRENANMKIGNGVFFNSSCTISCIDKIIIGNDTLFGSGVCIYDHNHNYKDRKILIKEQGYNSSPVYIGDNCWIGANAIILKGVSIGSNTVIGAGVIVYNDVPENSLLINKQECLLNEI